MPALAARISMWDSRAKELVLTEGARHGPTAKGCMPGGLPPCQPPAERARLLQFQLHRPALLLPLLSHFFRRFHRCLHGVAPDGTQDFGGYRTIHPQAAERDAPRTSLIHVRSPALVAQHHSLAPAIANIQHPPAPPAAQQAAQQRVPAPAGLRLHPRFHLNVACHDRLVAFVLLPRNVPAMVVHNQDRPFGARFLVPHALAGPALYYRGLASGLSEGVGSAVDRIAQQAPQCVVGGRSPEGGATGLLRISARQGDALPVEPQQHLTRTSQFRHLRKHQGQHLLHPLIRLLLHPVPGPHIAYRQAELQFAAPRFLSNRRGGPLLEQIQLELAHGALQPKQQTVVHQAGVVDALRVYDHRSGQAAQFQQRVPLPAIARQARGFQAEDSAHRTGTYRAHQLLVAGALHQPRCRAPQVLIDHRDLLETHLVRVLAEGILLALALQVVQHLARRGLADIDYGSALQSFSGQLGVQGWLLSPRRVRWRRGAATPSGLESVAGSCRAGAPGGWGPAGEG